MKRMKLTKLAALLVATATLTVTSSNALTSIQVQEIKSSVLSVPVPEMPAKAATLVKNAEKKDRQAVALTAVRAIVLKHRAAAPLVVSAISKVAPELAPIVAAASAEIAPDQAASIAMAAVAAAPTQAAMIRDQVIQAAPAKSTMVVASVNRTSRGSASQPTGGGTITITDRPINQTQGGGGTGTFSSTPPNAAQDPRVIYNQPPQ